MMKLTTLIMFVGCLFLCGCASVSKEPEPKIITMSQFRAQNGANHPRYIEFTKYFEDISLENTKEVSIKFRAKKNSNAPANALVGVKLIVGKEIIFHLKKDPHRFSSTNTWENLEYNFDSMEEVTRQLDSPMATVHVYISADKSESIAVDNIVVEVKKSNQKLQPTVKTPVEAGNEQGTAAEL